VEHSVACAFAGLCRGEIARLMGILSPAANGFMADDDPMRGQHFLNHPQTEDMTAPKIKRNAAK
jgi:hypothetical protein